MLCIVDNLHMHVLNTSGNWSKFIVFKINPTISPSYYINANIEK